MLRSYQADAVDVLVKRLRMGGNHLLVMPTGAGKSVTARAIFERLGLRTFAITHRRELRDQLGIRGATIQSVLSQRPRELAQADLVVWDEAHHSVAPRWSQVGLPPKVLGLTATPVKGMALLWDSIYSPVDYPELVRAGTLCPIRLMRPSKHLGSDLAKTPLQAYQEHARGLPGFVYVASVREAKETAQSFRKAGFRAAHIVGSMATQARRGAIELFKGGQLDVLVNVHTLTEGLNVPRASVAILGRGMSSVETMLQCAGRVLRPHPGKARALILDLSGCTWVHGSPIEAREYTLTEGTTRTDVTDCPQCARAYERRPQKCVCGWDFVTNSGNQRRTRVLNEELYDMIPNQPEAIWPELSTKYRNNLMRAGIEYKRLTGEKPPWTKEQKTRLRRQEIEKCKARGYKLGRAWHRIRSIT